jgi:hypothetical protein
MMANSEGSVNTASNGIWRYGLYALVAALLLVALGFGMRHWEPAQASANNGDLSVLRERLFSDPSSVRGNWLRTLNPLVQDVQGDLVWNSTQSQGVMRFVDLPAPATGQFYQLWLYDTRSADGVPVSGAVVRNGVGKGEWFAAIKTERAVITPFKFELHLHADKSAEKSQLLLMVQP